MGWKDILRPIRDGLRDNLPGHEPRDDEAARTRLKQRHDNALKGFAFFDTFEELDVWKPDNVDPLQRANTPLLHRSAGTSFTPPKAKVTLIHDYGGNYHDYESCQATAVHHLPDYACRYLQYVDTFVYFSHKLVCVPPPTWTNCLHSNGVKSFGTFLVEPQTPGIAAILERRPCNGTPGKSWQYPVASVLVDMAHAYGFDGWLLNLEKTFPITKWSADRLEGFICQLSFDLGPGSVIWYDALTARNTIDYQNSLTSLNLRFARAAGSILTNYAWAPDMALEAKTLALQSGMDPANIIFGIDVWAQNARKEGQPVRKTWPAKGGGGTGTGRAVAKLAAMGLSAGIFAPAWPYEHFDEGYIEVDCAMWHGTSLPHTLVCDCGPASLHGIDWYRDFPIARSAQEYCSGSSTFFFAHLGQPSPPRSRDLKQESVSHLSCSQQGSNPQPQLENDQQRLISNQTLTKLFNLHMPNDNTLEARITFSKAQTSASLTVLVFEGLEQEMHFPLQACESSTVTMTLPARASSVLIGLTLRMDTSSEADSINLHEICIRHQALARQPLYRIAQLRMERWDKDCSPHTRLSWAFVDEDISRRQSTAGDRSTDDGVPYSSLTGPFSHFLVSVNGRLVARAYALECVLDDQIAKRLMSEDGMMVTVEGISFDGSSLCTYSRPSESLRTRKDSWQVVTSTGSVDSADS